MKKILLIHGFEGNRDGNWLPWIEEQLTRLGHNVINKNLPDPEHPDFERDMEFLRELTKEFSNDDIVIGHSLGGYFALRLAEEKQLNHVIIVAPAIGNLPEHLYHTHWNEADLQALFSVVRKGFNIEKIKAQHKFAIFSEDDIWVPPYVGNLLDESWEVKVVDGYAHFQNTKFPLLLKKIKEYL